MVMPLVGAPCQLGSIDAMVEWQDWEFRSVSDKLDVAVIVDRPESWNAGIRSIEATIETLLAFNLSELVGMPLTLVRRAYPIEPAADIIATDPLRRIHLFELKKGSVSGQSAAQLEQYLFKHVFGDADRFLADAAKLGKAQASQLRLARDIAGVWANERTGIVGFKKALRELNEGHPLLNPGGRRLTAYRYGKLSQEDQLVVVHAALAVHAAKRDLAFPKLNEVLETARTWEDRLACESVDGPTRLVAERRLVVWLVGSNISPAALERVRLWRRSGIDARVLRVTARSTGGRWVLGVRRELAPDRDEVEQDLFERATDSSRTATRVKAVFYDERPASKNSRLGGALLEKPRIGFR